MQNSKILTLSLMIGLALTAGITFATATWQNTDWISDGSAISTSKMKDNFDYLYERVSDSDTLADINCTTGQIAKYSGGAWECADCSL